MTVYRMLIYALSLGLSIEAQTVDYGADVSTTIHHDKISTNYAEYPWNIAGSIVPTPPEYQGMAIQPLGNRQAFYDEMIQGCVKYYGNKGFRCQEYEQDRIEMNYRQPQSMENYTEMGFQKIRAPENVWKLIKSFWDRNKEDQSPENWPAGNTYTNHWTSPTRIANIENTKLRGGGLVLKQAIWDAAKDTIAEWTNSTLHDVSLYGIRVYTRGSVLASHVDRLPLVSSAIICVDIDVEEPWPLEVIGHDGRAHNVTMEPGDMVLYESHSIIHGRPFPLKGNYVANLFVHFEPENHSSRYMAKNRKQTDIHAQYRKDMERGVGGHEIDNHLPDLDTLLPPYIIPGSPEVANYLARNPESKAGKLARHKKKEEGTTIAHTYAAAGEVTKLAQILEEKQELITAADSNGWTPLHEGTRAGSVEVVRLLLAKGANINHRTGKNEKGYSVLALAHEIHGPDHPISKFIASVGGELIEPEL